MMVPVTATLFSISVVNCYSFIADADGIPPVDNTIQEGVSENRKPRSSVTTGREAILKLLGSSRRIFSDGINAVFVKEGSLDDAIQDFNSLNPTNVNGVIMNRGNEPTHLTGRVENLRIAVLEKEGSVTLDITTIPNAGQFYVVPVVHKTIVYTN